jgi:two-component system nitrate/nitrite response regulator NarP
LQALHGNAEAPRVIVYTGDADPETPRMVMELGGAGFCSKTASPEQLLNVIENVARGQMVFPFRSGRATAEDTNGISQLTPRETELLRSLGSGRTNVEIAHDLGVSPNTVKFHLRNLYGKLNVRNRAEAVARHLAQ